MWIGHHKEILKADISSISFNQIDVSSVSLGSGWQPTSKPETTITPILICFICFGSRVEKEELRVHPVDNLAIINNIWYPARPLAAVIKYWIQKIKVFCWIYPRREEVMVLMFGLKGYGATCSTRSTLQRFDSCIVYTISLFTLFDWNQESLIWGEH